MTLHLDRTEVEANAGVLAYIPQPNVEETMTWVNRIFRSSEPNTLNEKRTNITPYPAITVNYQYLIPCDKLDLISMVRDHPNPVFFIPLYHQMMICESYEFMSGNMFKLTVRRFRESPGAYFPFHRFLAIVGRTGSVVYKETNPIQTAQRSVEEPRLWELTMQMTADQINVLKTDQEYYIAPVAKAYIDSRVQYDIPGEGRDGATMRTVFRFDSEWERELSYVTTIDFARYAQIPIVQQQNRNQVSWTAPTEISQSLAYAPYAKSPTVGNIHVIDYFLPTADFRRDYHFRGNLMLNKGAFESYQYIYNNDPDDATNTRFAPVYRLEDDRAVITYLPGRATARLRLLEVDERYQFPPSAGP